MIRHPRLAVSGQHYCYGQLNLGLAPGALLDCQRNLQHRLEQFGPAQAFSSPLQRCSLLADALRLQPSYDYRLMERHFGHWQGRAWADFQPQEFDPWLHDTWGFAPPGGENALQLAERVLDFLSVLPQKKTILVTHAGIIRLLQSWTTQQALVDTQACDYGEALIFDWSMSQARQALEGINHAQQFTRA